VVLVTMMRSASQADIQSSSTTRLYLDARTFLPVASTFEIDWIAPRANGQGPNMEVHGRRHSTYRHTFIRSRSLPDDLFETASIAAWAAADTSTPLDIWRGGTVPDVTGLPRADAEAALAAFGCSVRVGFRDAPSAREGTVLSQSPAAGQVLACAGDVFISITVGT
jgi:hypothetical protein